MAFFPSQVMPKALRKETINEVDSSPLIYNAKDWNAHHRELRAMQQVLLGGGSADQPYGISQLVSVVDDLISNIFDGSLVAQYAGTIKAGEQVSIPDGLTSTLTSGAVSAGDTVITVSSTDGFPDSGVITKFNGLDVQERCTNGGAPGGGGSCPVGQPKFMEYSKFIGASDQRTFQEVITYNGKTSTQFLNCTRGINGTTAEDLDTDEQAAILLGNAALWLAPNVWIRDTNKEQTQFYITYTPDLTVDAHLLEQGSRVVVKPDIQQMIEITWGMTVVSYYELPNIEQVFGAVPLDSNPSSVNAPADLIRSIFGSGATEDKFGPTKIFGSFSGSIRGYASVRLSNTNLPGSKVILSLAAKSKSFVLDTFGGSMVVDGDGASRIGVFKMDSNRYGMWFEVELGDMATSAEAFGYVSTATGSYYITLPLQIVIGGSAFARGEDVKVSGGSFEST